MKNNFRASDVEVATRMRDAGVRLDLGAFDKDLIVQQDREPGANLVAQCYLISTHMVGTVTTHVKVIWNGSGPFMLCGFQLRLPWKYGPVMLLPDPADPSAPQIYKFSDHDAARFDKSQVIVQSGKTLRRGQFIEGFLLAIDDDPIPPEIRQGERITASLTIVDQFGEEHSNDLVLWADRSAEWRPKPAAPKPRKRLSDGPDKRFGELPRDTEFVDEG